MRLRIWVIDHALSEDRRGPVTADIDIDELAELLTAAPADLIQGLISQHGNAPLDDIDLELHINRK